MGLVVWRRHAPIIQAQKLARAQMREGFLLTDQHSRITQLNPAAAEMLGASPSRLIGQDLTRLAWVNPGLLEKLPPPGAPPIEVTLEREGGVRHLHANAAPLHGRGGRPRGHLISLWDATDTRRTEEDLRAAEAHYRIMAEQTTDWVFWLSPEGRILDMSPSCEQLTGHRADEFISDPELFSRIIHPDDLIPWKTYRGRVEQGQSDGELEYRIIRQDGATRWMLLTCSLIVDDTGRCLGARCNSRDITERKLAEEALRQTNAELNTIFQALPDLYFRLAADGTILDHRAGRVSDLYVAPEVFLGQRMPDILPDDIGRRLAQAFQQVLETGQRVRVEYALPMPGGIKFYEARLSRCRSDQIIAVIRNISDYKEAQAALQEANDRLEARVNDRTAELMRLNARLKEEIDERQQIETELRALNMTLEQRVNDRTRALTALYHISAAAVNAGNLAAFLERSLAEVATALHSEAGIIMLLNPDGAAASLTQWHLNNHPALISELQGQDQISGSKGHLFATVLPLTHPLLIPDMTEDPRVPESMHKGQAKSLLIGPLKADGQTLGVIGLTRKAAQSYEAEESALFATMADQIGAAIQSHQLCQIAQEAVLLDERQRLARELHSVVAQNLYGLVTFTEAGLAQLETADFANIHGTLERIGETLRQTLREMRLFIHQLRPDVLKQEGLVGALHLRLAAVEGRSDIQTEFRVDETITLTQPLESALYQVAREALNNILRHAHATTVSVTLYPDGDRVALKVTDDGRGFDPQTLDNGGLGMAIMRQAMEEVGGDLEIVSAPGKGTQVRASWRFSNDADSEEDPYRDRR